MEDDKLLGVTVAQTCSAPGAQTPPSPLQGLPCGAQVSSANLSSALVLGQHIQLVLEIEAGVRYTPALEKLSVKVDTDPQVVNAAWCDIGCG